MTRTTKAANAKVEEFTAEAQKNFSEGVEKATKSFDEINTFGQGNMEAVKKSSDIATKAVETIGAEVSAYSKKSFEDTVAAAKDIAASKNLTELFEKQTAFAQSAFDGFVQQAAKMQEIYTDVAKNVGAPLSDRATVAGETMKSFKA